MRVCVVGCGAIGGIYAGHLAQLDRRRGVGLRRSAAHVAAIKPTDSA